MSFFDELKRQRDDAQARASRLNDAIGKLGQLQAGVDQAERGLAEHDRDVAAGMEAWARMSGEGELPDHGHDKRLGLSRAVDEAKAALASGNVARDGLLAKLRDVNVEAERINASILAHAISQARQEQVALVADVERLVLKELRPRLAKIRGLRAHLTGLAQRAQSSGRDEAARGLFGAATSLAEVVVEADATPGEIHIAASEWAQRLGELMGAAPERVAPPVDRIAEARAHAEAAAVAHRRAMEGNRPAGNVVVAA